MLLSALQIAQAKAAPSASPYQPKELPFAQLAQPRILMHAPDPAEEGDADFDALYSRKPCQHVPASDALAFASNLHGQVFEGWKERGGAILGKYFAAQNLDAQHVTTEIFSEAADKCFHVFSTEFLAGESNAALLFYAASDITGARPRETHRGLYVETQGFMAQVRTELVLRVMEGELSLRVDGQVIASENQAFRACQRMIAKDPALTVRDALDSLVDGHLTENAAALVGLLRPLLAAESTSVIVGEVVDADSVSNDTIDASAIEGEIVGEADCDTDCDTDDIEDEDVLPGIERISRKQPRQPRTPARARNTSDGKRFRGSKLNKARRKFR